MRVEENQGHTVRRGRTTPGLIPKIKRYALPDDFQRGVAIELTEVVFAPTESTPLVPAAGSYNVRMTPFLVSASLSSKNSRLTMRRMTSRGVKWSPAVSFEASEKRRMSSS